MAENTGSQNVTQTVGTNTGAMQGVAAGRDANAVQQTTQGTPAEEISQDEAVKLIEEIGALLEKADLPPEAKEEMADYTKMAQKEAKKPEPRKNLITGNLEAATSILTHLSKTTDAAKETVNKLKPIFQKLAPWLGIAATAATHFFGG